MDMKPQNPVARTAMGQQGVRTRARARSGKQSRKNPTIQFRDQVSEMEGSEEDAHMISGLNDAWKHPLEDGVSEESPDHREVARI